ncbi:MAG: hypothetical protein ACI9QD_000919 [Thermoproteota archaeon]|jgi:hypothetical protein
MFKDKKIDILSEENLKRPFGVKDHFEFIHNNFLFGEHGFPVYENLGEESFKVEINVKYTEEPPFAFFEVDQVLLKSKIAPIIDTIPLEPSSDDGMCDLITTSFRPNWFFYHYPDGAETRNVAMGSLTKHSHWLNLILYFLLEDLADQDGGGEFFMFDAHYKWSISFYLSQEKDTLEIRKWIKK